MKKKELFNPAHLKKSSIINVNDLFEIIFKGGMSKIYTERIMRDMFFESYIETYLKRDIRELNKIKDLIAFRKFLVSVASRTGEQLNYNSLADDAGISVPTAQDWLSIVVRSGLVYLLEPYMSTELKRITHMSKIIFMDTGLCSYLAGFKDARKLQLSSSAGHYL